MRSSHRRMQENEDVRLATLHESDYGDDDPMNVGRMATTNFSHDSDTVKEAEKNFRQMLERGDKDDESHRKEPDAAAIDDQEEETKVASPETPKTDGGEVFSLEDIEDLEDLE